MPKEFELLSCVPEKYEGVPDIPLEYRVLRLLIWLLELVFDTES